MRFLSIFLTAVIGFAWIASAQDIPDVSNLKADPLTFIFDDGKHTVNGYIYSVVREKTSCCGNDAIYLEVVFDAQGLVTSSKTLTGKNDCYKKSIVDIVKSIRWDANGVKSNKTIYFEVKPMEPCSGSPGENTYVPISFGEINIADSGPVEELEEVEEEVVEEVEEVVEEAEEEVGVAFGEEEEEEVFEEEEEEEMEEYVEEEEEMEEYVEEEEEVEEYVEEEVEEEMEEEVAVVEEEEEEAMEETEWEDGVAEEGFLTEESSSSEEVSQPVRPVTTRSTAPPVTTRSAPATDPQRRSSKGVKIPPQADIPYVSAGDRSPQDAHNKSFKNISGPLVNTPTYADNESEVAVYIKSKLRKNGVCGLAQALVEVTLDPTGNVVKSNVMKANAENITGLIPDIMNGLKFRSQNSVRYNYTTYFQFKTDIICAGEKRQPMDLDQIPDYLNLPQ